MSEFFRKPIVKTLMLKGQEGQSIKGITKTGTDVLVDTYTITLTDGTTSTFTVTNGKEISGIEKTGADVLVDTYTIEFNDGTNSTFTVTNGKGISNIRKTETDVLVDTYTIKFNDGTTSTFTVTNGKGISNISKTETSGLVDTYTIEFNDGTTSTFTVTNGDSAYKPAVEALGKRIDNLILSSGTESSAEVVDARNGYDGTTYDTLGTAIRSQISELKGDLVDLVGYDTHIELGNYIANSFVEVTGPFTDFGGWHRTDYIEIGEHESTIIHFTNSANKDEPYNCFYDENHVKVGANFNTNNKDISIPNGAKYFALSSEDYISMSAIKVVAPITDRLEKKTFEDYVKNNEENVLTRNRELEPFVIQSTSGRCEEFGDTIKPLTFVHFSDVHTNSKAWTNICDYMDKYNEHISFGLHTGDYCGNYQGSYVDLYLKKKSIKPILNCIGNHDVYAQPNGKFGTRKSVYDLLFNHTDDWNVIFENISNPTNYYKDFPNSKIRLIVMDYYFTDETDMTWFNNTLNSAKTLGYSVITAMHEVTKPIIEKIDCTFQTLDDYESKGGNASVHAFDSAIKSFVDNGGTHICNLVGHEHADMIGYTVGNVLNIVIECATNNTTWTDAKRIENTKTFDCFNVFTVDVQNHVFKIVRIGNNSDHYLRPKNILVYDYLNKKVIHNS